MEGERGWGDRMGSSEMIALMMCSQINAPQINAGSQGPCIDIALNFDHLCRLDLSDHTLQQNVCPFIRSQTLS